MGAKFCAFIKNFDIFGEPISLMYRGKTAYNTGLGALVSIIYSVIMIYYAYLVGADFVLRRNADGT